MTAATPLSPTTPGTAAGNSPAVPVEHLTRWAVALNLLVEDVRFQLPHHGIEQRLRDVLDDIRATRQHAGDLS